MKLTKKLVNTGGSKSIRSKSRRFIKNQRRFSQHGGEDARRSRMARVPSNQPPPTNPPHQPPNQQNALARRCRSRMSCEIT